MTHVHRATRHRTGSCRVLVLLRVGPGRILIMALVQLQMTRCRVQGARLVRKLSMYPIMVNLQHVGRRPSVMPR